MKGRKIYCDIEGCNNTVYENWTPEFDPTTTTCAAHFLAGLDLVVERLSKGPEHDQ